MANKTLRKRQLRPAWVVTKAAHYAVPEPLLGPRHRHKGEFQVFKILDADGKMVIAGKTFEPSQTGLFWIPPGVWHYSIDEEPCCPHMLEMRFRPQGSQRLPVDPTTFPFHIERDPQNRVQELIRRIVDEYSRKQHLWEWRIAGLIDAMILEVARAIESPPDPLHEAGHHYRPDPDAIHQAMRLIQERYHEPLTLADLAKAATMSVSRFGKLFHAQEGKTPIEYLIDYRLQRAMELMEDQRLTLSQIAYAVGFGSIHHFSRTFRSRFGVPPAQWKRG